MSVRLPGKNARPEISEIIEADTWKQFPRTDTEFR